MKALNPIDPKVVAGTAATGVAGFVVVLLMNVIRKEPLDQAALEGVITAVVTAAFAYVAAWLKKSGLDVLIQRTLANGASEVVEPSGTRHVRPEIGETSTPDERGHVDLSTVLVMTAVAIVVFVLGVLIVRAF